MIVFWLVILIAALLIEVLTMGLTSVWFAGGALAALLALLLQAPVELQVILFVVVSLLLLFFTRPIAVRYFNKNRVRTNVESLIGRQAIVTSEIDNLHSIGRVTVGGQEWSARSVDDEERIPVGGVVLIDAISGVKLIVRPDEQMKGKGPTPSPVPEPMSVRQMEELEQKRR